MSYELLKPYTSKEYADFVCLHQGLKPYENETAFYFLEANEMVNEQGEIVINPNYEDELAQRERARIDALVLTKRQFFLSLLNLHNITPSQVEQVVEQAGSDSAKIEFQYASGFLRGNPLFNELAPVLSLTTAQIDEVFEEGQDY